MMSEIKLSSELLDGISGNYKKCVMTSEEIITGLRKAKTEFISGYQGQGYRIANDTLAKAVEHMELLMECFEQIEKYVDHTSESFKALEENLKIFIK
jgi:uncharacterized protein YukE